MSINISVEAHPDYLNVLVTGEYDYKMAVGLFDIVLSACKLNNTSNILVDYRSVKGEPLMTDRYMYASSISDKVKNYIEMGGNKLRFAYLGPQKMIMDDSPANKVFEKHYFIDVLATTSATEAYEWLGVDSNNQE